MPHFPENIEPCCVQPSIVIEAALAFFSQGIMRPRRASIPCYGLPMLASIALSRGKGGSSGGACVSDIMGWAPDLEGKRMKPPKPSCATGGGIKGSQSPVGPNLCALCSSLREADRHK